MQKTIFKYKFEVNDNVYIEMPLDSDILSVHVQNGIPCLWALVDVGNERERRRFEIFVTGHPVECNSKIVRKFIGTFQLSGEDLVFHLFERIN